MPPLRPIAVLLVDDQRLVGAAITHLLATETDLEVHCCLDPTGAVARANAISPGVILQDLVMPGLDGLALVKLFRENPATARTPIVVLSGNDDAGTRARALAAGASDYLVKVPPKAALIACIRRWLAGLDAAAPEMVPAAAPLSTTSEPTLDRGVIAAIRDMAPAGATDFAAMLIDQFVAEASAQVDALTDASHRGDTKALKATAHSLKGSAMTMGARRLAAHCAELEADVREQAPVTAARVTAIADELVRVREACRVERQGMLA